MSKLPKLLVFLTALSPASALAARPVDPAPVVAAERAFAADGVALGWVAAFKKHVAPDGVTFSPDPVNAPANLAKQDDKKEGPDLVWWPLWAGLSRSGDLGFTTGPFRIGVRPAGQYFTVWQRQSDGGWKWVFDGGPRVITPNAPPPGTEPGALAPATGPQVSAKVAMAQVDAAEAKLAAVAHADAAAAYRAALAADARIAGLSGKLAVGPALTEGELNARAKAIDFRRLGGSASRAGDLAWTYGDAAWAADGQARRGHYVRIWRHDRAGWAIVFDELLPVPPPRKAG